MSCSGGTLGLKVEYGLAPPPALYDSIRDGVADMTWIVYGYTPGKFVTTMIAELSSFLEMLKKNLWLSKKHMRNI